MIFNTCIYLLNNVHSFFCISVFTGLSMYEGEGDGAYKTGGTGRFVMTLAPGSIGSSYINASDSRYVLI